MQDDLYFYIMVLGVIVIGFAWLIPDRGSKGKTRDSGTLANEEQRMDRVHLLSEFKQDMDKKMSLLSSQIRDLRAEMEELKRDRSNEGALAGEGKEDGLKLNQRYADIFDLQKQGRSKEEIAKMLDMGVGEVAMIIQLHRMASGDEKRNSHGRNTP